MRAHHSRCRSGPVRQRQRQAMVGVQDKCEDEYLSYLTVEEPDFDRVTPTLRRGPNPMQAVDHPHRLPVHDNWRLHFKIGKQANVLRVLPRHPWGVRQDQRGDGYGCGRPLAHPAEPGQLDEPALPCHAAPLFTRTIQFDVICGEQKGVGQTVKNATCPGVHDTPQLSARRTSSSITGQSRL